MGRAELAQHAARVVLGQFKKCHKRRDPGLHAWEEGGHAMRVLGVGSQADMLLVQAAARTRAIPTHTFAGMSKEEGRGQRTVMAVGPAPADQLDEVRRRERACAAPPPAAASRTTRLPHHAAAHPRLPSHRSSTACGSWREPHCGGRPPYCRGCLDTSVHRRLTPPRAWPSADMPRTRLIAAPFFRCALRAIAAQSCIAPLPRPFTFSAQALALPSVCLATHLIHFIGRPHDCRAHCTAHGRCNASRPTAKVH